MPDNPIAVVWLMSLSWETRKILGLKASTLPVASGMTPIGWKCWPGRKSAKRFP